MSFLKLNWCQLIRIILSQIGGNPLQQVYSQLNQGMATMAPGGVLPQGLSQIKNLIETTTAVINAAQQAANNYTDVVDRMTNEFFQNPVGTVTTQTITAIDARVTSIDNQIAADDASPGTLTPEQRTSLQNEKTFLVGSNGSGGLKADLNTFKTNTDRLSGVGNQSSSSQSGCSLQDLLGSGCTPNNDVPDVDIQALIESLKKGDAIAAVKEKILNATGVSDLQQSIASFKTEIAGINASFTSTLNKAAVRNAVTSQITQIVFNLLTGCGNTVFNLTLKDGVKTAVAPYVALLEAEREGTAFRDSEGNVTTTVDTEFSPEINNVVINPNLDKGVTRYEINGVTVSKEEYDRERSKSATLRLNELLSRKQDIENRISSISQEIEQLRIEELRLVSQGRSATGDDAGRLSTAIQRNRDITKTREAQLGQARLALSSINVEIERARSSQ